MSSSPLWNKKKRSNLPLLPYTMPPKRDALKQTEGKNVSISNTEGLKGKERRDVKEETKEEEQEALLKEKDDFSSYATVEDIGLLQDVLDAKLQAQ